MAADKGIGEEQGMLAEAPGRRRADLRRGQLAAVVLAVADRAWEQGKAARVLQAAPAEVGVGAAVVELLIFSKYSVGCPLLR